MEMMDVLAANREGNLMNWIDEEVAVPSPSASLVESGSELQLSGPPQSKVALQGRSTSQFEESDKVDGWPSIMASLPELNIWVKLRNY